MSIKIMTRVWDEAPFDKTTLLLMLCLADHANDDGECWPSVTRLANRARCTERWARDCLKQLTEAGWLERNLRPGNTTKYRILFPKQAQTPEPQFTPEESSPRNSTSGVERGEESSPRNSSSGPPRNPSSGDPGSGVPMNHQEPSLEPSVDVVASPEKPELRSLRNGWQPGSRAMATAKSTTKILDLQLHILKYEVWCTRNKRNPNDGEWLTWLVRDEQEAQDKERKEQQDQRGEDSWYKVAD